VKPAAGVGAVVVTHDDAAQALSCVRSLHGQVPRSQMVVVVNLPDRIEPEALDALAESAGHLVLNNERKGYGANLNDGVSRLRGQVDAYLCLNDDTIVGEQAVARLEAVLTRQPDAGLVGPALMAEGDHSPHGPFCFPSIASEFAVAAILPGRLKERLLERLTVDRRRWGCRAVDWVLGAALLFRAEAFDAVGGFDERYFFYSEEVDVAYRLRAHGWRCYLCPEAVVEHAGGFSADAHWRREALGRGRGKFIHQHWTPRRRNLLRPVLAVTYAWNVAYIAVRVVLAPRRASEKLDLLASTWQARTRV
jgi:N-acetylglucosaminyl-diphospho-decaprenol L-rhamnosyltransferase